MTQLKKCFGTRQYNFDSKICKNCNQNILCYEEFYRELNESMRCSWCHGILEFKNYGTILKCCNCDFKMDVPVILRDKAK
jgi:hypothetical protein